MSANQNNVNTDMHTDKEMGDSPKTASAESVFAEIPPQKTYFFAQNLAIARKMNNRRAFQVLRDIVSISWHKKRFFNAFYYFKYQMYEFAAVRPTDMYDYINDVENLQWNRQLNCLVSTVNPVDNKVQFELILRQLGMRVTETQRVLLNRPMPMPLYLTTVEEGVNFFKTQANYPLFCKPDKSSRSVGIFWADEYVEETNAVRVRGVGDVEVSELVTLILKMFGDSGFLLQSRLIQHEEFARVAGQAIGCVRIVTLRVGEEIEPLYAVWKVPAMESLADNFWA